MLLFPFIFEKKRTDAHSVVVPDLVLVKSKAFLVSRISSAMPVALPCCQEIVIHSR